MLFLLEKKINFYSSNALSYFFAWNPSWQKDFFQGFCSILSQNLQIFQDGFRNLLSQYCVLGEKLNSPKRRKETAPCVLCLCEDYCKHNEIEVLISAFIGINLKKVPETCTATRQSRVRKRERQEERKSWLHAGPFCLQLWDSAALSPNNLDLLFLAQQ